MLHIYTYIDPKTCNNLYHDVNHSHLAGMVPDALQAYWKGFCQDTGVSRLAEPTEVEE